jgi:hypothetical protein
MTDETQLSGRKVLIAGQLRWTAIRAGQFLLVVFFAKAVYLSYNTSAFTEMLWSGILFVVLFLLLPFHGVSTGWADTSGLHYRRYFRLLTLPWADVKEIRWQGSRLRIVRKNRDFLLNRIVFLLKPFSALPGYYGQRLGGDAPLPEIIESLLAIPKEEEVPVVTAPPAAKWMLRAFAGFALFFLLIVLLKLVLASLH